MNSAIRRIAAETWQRASNAIANVETDGANFSCGGSGLLD